MDYSSFELNQSCPTLGKKKQNTKLQTSLQSFAKFRGDECNSCCYSGYPDDDLLAVEKPCFFDCDAFPPVESRPISRSSINASWSSFPDMSSIISKKSNFSYDFSHKAVLTVDAKTSKVLTANKQACVLFEHSSDSLVHSKLSDLLKNSCSNSGPKNAFMQEFSDVEGTVTVCSGKVVEIITKRGNVIPVSVWIRKYESNEKNNNLCLVIIETVSRITGVFTFSAEEINEWIIQGIILSCDDNFSRIHGYPAASSLVGVNLNNLMPSYHLPQFGSQLDKTVRKQRTTSTTADGLKFPISVYIKSQERNKDGEEFFQATVWFFTNISGPLTISEDGIILNLNSNFSLALLGYTSNELQKKSISTLIPEIVNNCDDKIELDLQNVSKEKITSALTEATDHRFVTSHDCTSSDSRSSFVNISLLDSNSFNSPSNTPLDRINSLLLGKCTPSAAPSITKTQTGKDESYGCAFGQRIVDDSWVEISMNSDLKPTDDGHKESESIRQVNLLLNGSRELIEERKSLDLTSDLIVPSPEANERHAAQFCVSGYQSASNSPLQGKNLAIFDKENDVSNVAKAKIVSRLTASANVTSTPVGQEKKKPRFKSRKTLYKEGHFEGHALHKDGSLIAIRYEVRYVASCQLYCLWLSMDLENARCNSSLSSNQTLRSSFNSTLPSLNASYMSGICDYSLGAAIKQAAQRLNESSSSALSPLEGTDEWLAIQGRFGEHYEIRRAIGNGAFGFVRNARHKKTNRKVVVKFIRKEKVLDECWVEDYESNSLMPLEIVFLLKFDHPNIVKVLDFYENDDFFSMVMPTHGSSGIDLFEFIEREPLLNELIASYIFRQIASAVYYLHKNRVVHRDIKDENVIIDESFTCKLIDFGSAAYFDPDSTFSTFCGTVEYCSPEVLMGERYTGPELEVWALGITLYTLVYGENPFKGVEDTIEGKLHPPHFLSPDLMKLICKMLQPVPEHRCSILSVVEDGWVNMPVNMLGYKWEEIVPPANHKESFVDVSTMSKSNAQQDENDSISSRETLAEHLRKWKGEAGCIIGADKFDDSENSNFIPLTRHLENLNLNHSI